VVQRDQRLLATESGMAEWPANGLQPLLHLSVAEYIDRNRIRPMTRAELRAAYLAGE
jgi:hypothetical protein